MESVCCEVANVQNSNKAVNEFKLQSRYYINFSSNISEEVYKPPYPRRLWVKLYHYSSSTRMYLVLNNPRCLIYHLTKKLRQTLNKKTNSIKVDIENK